MRFKIPQIGERYVADEELAKLHFDGTAISILTPSDAVIDRLSKYFYHQDTSALNHAIAVAKKYPVNLDRIRSWCISEHREKDYDFFIERLKRSAHQPDEYSKKIERFLKLN